MRELAPWLRLLAIRRARLLLGGLLMALTIAGGIGLLALSGWFITATGITALSRTPRLVARRPGFIT